MCPMTSQMVHLDPDGCHWSGGLGLMAIVLFNLFVYVSLDKVQESQESSILQSIHRI